MRIGIVCPYSFEVPGGVQRHVHDLAETLIALGHEVSVLAPADDDVPLPSYVVPAGRAVPVRYNGSVARLVVRAGVGRPGPAVAGRRRLRRASTCTSRSRRAWRCWPCSRPGTSRWSRPSTPR